MAKVPGLFLPTIGPSSTANPAFLKFSLTIPAQEYVAKIASFPISLLMSLKKETVHNSGFFGGEKGSRKTALNPVLFIFLTVIGSINSYTSVSRQ